MQFAKLSDMTGGWFVGAFEPTLLRTSDFEVAIKAYRAGDREPAHHHRIAEEVTVIVSGRARMCGRELGQGEMVLLAPKDSTSFEALEDTVTVVVKRPSIPGDKYLD
jgi:mannose-6-phosphate isomerase-like protein (cupin superfamily)